MRSRRLLAVCGALTMAASSAALASCAKDGEPTASPIPAPAATVTTTVTTTATSSASGTATPTPSASGSGTTSPTPTSSGKPSSTATPTPTPKVTVGYVRGVVVKEGGTALVWDKAELVDGRVSNPSTAQRLLFLSPDYKVIAGPRLRSSSPDGQVSQEAFEAMFPMRNPPLVRLRFDDAGQVRIIQEYSG